MLHETETRPRQYARQILGMASKEERKAALANVPEHLQAMTKLHVEIAYKQRNKEERP